MQRNGTVDINTARNRLRNLLTHPESLSQCAPGLQSLEIVEPSGIFQAVAVQFFDCVRVKSEV